MDSHMADTCQTGPRFKLGNWVTIAIVSAVLLTTLALFALIDSFAHAYARKEAEERLKQLAWQMRDTLDRGLAERIVDMSVLAGLEQIAEADNPARMREILDGLQNGAPDAQQVGRKILMLAQQPFLLAGSEVHLSSSVGIALHLPGDALDAEALLRRADHAMYSAKNAGKNQLAMAAAAQSQDA